MKRIDSSEASDEGFGLFGNGVPVRTLKFDFGIGGLFGEGGGVVGTERRVAERTDERGELLVRGVEEFGSMKKMKEQRGEKWMGDSHAKVDDDNVTVGVLGAVEDVFGSVTWVKKQRERERKSSVLEVPMDDVVAVEVVDGIENRVDDKNSVVLCNLALCEDAVKELSNQWQVQKRDSILYETQSPRIT